MSNINPKIPEGFKNKKSEPPLKVAPLAARQDAISQDIIRESQATKIDSNASNLDHLIDKSAEESRSPSASASSTYSSEFNYEEAKADIERSLRGAARGVEGIPSLESDKDEGNAYDKLEGFTNESLFRALADPVVDEQPVLTSDVDLSFGPERVPRRTIIGNEEPDQMNQQPHNFPVHPQSHELAEDEEVQAALHPERPRAVRRSSVKLGPAAIGEHMLGRGLIQAKPLQMPDMLDVKPKDPTLMFRWVNFKSEEGRRVNLHLSMGFNFAQREDVQGPMGINIANSMGTQPNSVANANGWITCFDVVLMKIDKMTLLGAYEFNLQKSRRMVSRSGIRENALKQAISALREGLPANFDESLLEDKVAYFAPPSLKVTQT